MGRNPAWPENYRPLLQFYLRSRSEGGRLRIPGDIRASADEMTRRECLVLIHGFNNTDGEAAGAYSGFRARQAEIFSSPDPTAFEHRFGDAFWPGDADWWSFFDKADFLVYPSAVHTAVPAGAELASVLWRMPNLEQVDFLAHSLGCRVALEAVLALRARAVPRVRRLVLMAAAVPSEMLEPGGKFHDLLGSLATDGTVMEILHSTRDPVLHYAFPAGQSLAGGKEASARALGRFGPSPLMPGYHGAISEREIVGATHGDYWGNASTDPSRRATEEAGRFLAIGQIGRPLGTERAIGAPATEIVPRHIAAGREMVDAVSR